MHVLDPLPAADERALAAVLDEHFDVEVAHWQRLGGELDINYRATLADGGARFVRLSPTPLDEATFAWQNAVLEQLEERPLPVATPVLQRAADGSVAKPFVARDGRALRARVTSWVAGTSVAELGGTDAACRRSLGALAAEVPRSLHPLVERHDGQNLHHWMADRAGDSIRSTWDAVVDPARRALLEKALRRFDVIEPMLSTLPRAVVHQDLHDFNLLAERRQDGTVSIVGIVDFNDAVETVRIAELAVAAAYAALRQGDAFAAFADVVSGYAAHCSLTAEEIEVLYPLAVARLAVNASTWTHRGRKGNRAYAEARMAATWPALEQLLRVAPAEAAARFSAEPLPRR
ncbi:phosphotransferase [Leucobacter sp. NPDC077196]|uniref:phosphotransferase n=1 Tax=Leucobacter sp. NPDC077196 TaxID=3154959 RepID=UPI0034295234